MLYIKIHIRAKGIASIPISWIANERQIKTTNKEGSDNNMGNINPYALFLHLDNNTSNLNSESYITILRHLFNIILI